MPRRVWLLLRPFAPLLGGALGVMAVRGALIACVAYLVKPVLDDHLLQADLGIVRWAPLLVLAVYAAKAGLEYLQVYWMALAGDGLSRSLRESLYRHAITLPVSYYHRTAVTNVLARLLADVNYVQNIAAMSMLSILKDACTATALGVLLVYQNWRLALVALVVLPFGAYPVLRLGGVRRRRVQREQARLADLTLVAQEGLAGNKIVKAFGGEAREMRRFREQSDRFYALRRSMRRLVAASNPVIEMTLAVAAALIVAYGGFELLAGRMTLGELVSFFVALGLLYEPVKRIGRNNLDLQAGVGALTRVLAVLDEEPEPARADRPPLVVREGRIAFRHVDFSYEARPVLRDVSFEVAPGETVALVGRSGSGKSTIVDLLAGFLEPTAGAILVDGQDVREVSRASLRSHIAIVTQDVFLFTDTVRANIAYGRPDADPAAVERAARAAEVHDVIARLPEGYETILRERGVRLSGGERQRIAIARAFVRAAPILVLDEATSALDAATEGRVQRSLERLMAGRTVLVVAHRLSTIQCADRIIVLSEGRVIEEGSHQALLRRGGEYERLCREQFQAEPEPAPVEPLVAQR